MWIKFQNKLPNIYIKQKSARRCVLREEYARAFQEFLLILPQNTTDYYYYICHNTDKFLQELLQNLPRFGGPWTEYVRVLYTA